MAIRASKTQVTKILKLVICDDRKNICGFQYYRSQPKAIFQAEDDEEKDEDDVRLGRNKKLHDDINYNFTL